MSRPPLPIVVAGERPPDPFADPVARALVAMVDERGYEMTDVDAVVERAGVDRADFEARFAGKEDCVRKIYEGFIDDFLWRVRRAFAAWPDWRTALRASAYAAADWIDEHPRTTRFGMVDVLAARDEMIRVRREEIFQYCAGLIDRGREEAPDPAAVSRAAPIIAVGAIAQILTQRMQSGRSLETQRMVPELMYRAVRPYLGEERAREELGMPRPTEPPGDS